MHMLNSMATSFAITNLHFEYILSEVIYIHVDTYAYLIYK